MSATSWTLSVLPVLSMLSFTAGAQAENSWLVYEGTDGPGQGKHIVLVSGDEEYRSGKPVLGMRTATHAFRIKGNKPWAHDSNGYHGKKNDPMMPVAWTKSYRIPGGKEGCVFTTTMGSSTDLASQGTRRMLVNGVYWCAGLEDKIPAEGTQVDLVGEFKPLA